MLDKAISTQFRPPAGVGVGNAAATLERAAVSLAWTGAALLAVAELAIWASGHGSLAYLSVSAAAIAAGIWVAMTLPDSDRPYALALLVLALGLRASVHIVLFLGATRVGGPFLGPDSATYYHVARELASTGFVIDADPALYFGTYDAAHYYLFGGVVSLTGADLFELQWLNCCFTALIAPLGFAWARRVAPAFAPVVGAALAVFPSLITLAATDLLKDPSVMFAQAVAVLTLTAIVTGCSRAGLVAYGLLGAIALVYLRMSRFYLVAYLELAILGAAGLWLWKDRPVSTRWSAALVLAAVLSAGELVPWMLGWPPSPVMVVQQVTHTLDTPAMRSYSAGLFDRMARGPGGFRVRPARGAPAELPSSRRDLPWHYRIAIAGANLMRRVFGPFAWVPPSEWTLETILTGDYLLYPAMLVWYLVIPWITAGLGIAAVRIWRSRTALALLGAFLVYTGIQVAQYLAINLSYRQREAMLPFLLVFGCIGASALWHQDWWWRCYRWYGAAIAVVAAVHLAVTLAR